MQVVDGTQLRIFKHAPHIHELVEVLGVAAMVRVDLKNSSQECSPYFGLGSHSVDAEQIVVVYVGGGILL